MRVSLNKTIILAFDLKYDFLFLLTMFYPYNKSFHIKNRRLNLIFCSFFLLLLKQNFVFSFTKLGKG